MSVLGECFPLGVGEGAPERRFDPRQILPAEEFPGQVAGEGGHHDAMLPGDPSRRLFEGDHMARAGVAVGDQDVAEAGPRHGAAVVHEGIAHHPLADVHRPHVVEGEAPQVERWGQHDLPARPLGHDALGERAREVLGGEGVYSEGEVRAVLLERAHGDDHRRPLPIQGIEGGGGQLFQFVDAQKELPWVAVR